MSAVLEVYCGHCQAGRGEACRSVGDRPIVEPHMARLKAVAGGDDAAMDAERGAYALAVVHDYFGYVSPELLVRARKDRSLDRRKPWVQRALAGYAP